MHGIFPPSSNHPGEEGESHFKEVGILSWEGMAIRQSSLIEEESSIRLAERKALDGPFESSTLE